jgi:hypothetical protein
MSFATFNTSEHEEIIRKIWPPNQPAESTETETTTWEILNPNSNDPKDDNRHWFKQNYSEHHRLNERPIIYH